MLGFNSIYQKIKYYSIYQKIIDSLLLKASGRVFKYVGENCVSRENIDA